MRSIIKAGFVWCGILLSFAGYGQYESFSTVPLGALPMQYNGSFAGETGGPRISSNFRLEKGRNYNFRDYHLYTSYDQFIPAIRSGIGITAATHHAKSSFNSIPSGFPISNKYSYQMISIAIAPKFSIKGKYTISPSLDFSYGASNAKLSRNYFDTIPNSEPYNYSSQSLRSRAGLLFNSNKFYVGYSIDLLSRSFYKNIAYPPLGYDFNSYLQLGYTFQRRSTSKFSFTPQLAFQLYKYTQPYFQGANQSYYDRVRFGLAAFNLNFRYKQFIWGVNNTGFQLGWQTDKLKLMVSSGFGVSPNYAFYSANLSFRYVIQNKFSKKYVSTRN